MKEIGYAEQGMYGVIAHPPADRCPDGSHAVAPSQLSPWFRYDTMWYGISLWPSVLAVSSINFNLLAVRA